MKECCVTPIRCIIIICIMVCSIYSVFSQTRKSYDRVKEDTIIGFKDRWSFRTNAVGWVMTVPNAAVEFDLTESVYNKLTVGLEGKYNGFTSHTYLPYMVFNYWEVRPEIRKYWRTEYRANSGAKPTLYEKLFSRQRSKPRYWRAYYWGVYINYGGYDIKFSDEGILGNFMSTGVSAGYSVPLYSYDKGNIDIEFGGSVGIMMAKKNGFRLDRENNSYIPTANVKNWHIVPFPVVNDLRVSFIFRFKSIKDKYKRIDYEKIQRKAALRLEKQRIKDSIRVVEQIADSLNDLRKKFVKDSIANIKKQEDGPKEKQKKAFWLKRIVKLEKKED